MAELNILDNLTKNILYPQDTVQAALSGLAITALTNFRWLLPSKIDILKIDYSNYTVFNEDITNSLVIRQNTFDVVGLRQIDSINTYSLNIISNTLLLKLIRNYAKGGGLFTCITPIGLVCNLALKDLSITFNKTTPMFNFKFLQLNVSDSVNKKSMNTRETLCL